MPTLGEPGANLFGAPSLPTALMPQGLNATAQNALRLWRSYAAMPLAKPCAALPVDAHSVVRSSLPSTTLWCYPLSCSDLALHQRQISRKGRAAHERPNDCGDSGRYSWQPEALGVVLTDIDHHDPDLVVFAGYLVMNGPRPTETLARLYQLNTPSVIGNADIHVVEAATPVTQWTREQISAGGVAYL
jgi:hypothetical protein